MSKSWFYVSLLAVGVLLLISAAAAQDSCKCMVSATVDAGPFGSLVDAAEFSSGAAVQALPPAAFLTPPVRPLLSSAFLTNLPAVSQQGTDANPGSPGTCEAQSFGYGLGSYTAARQPDGSAKWNPALPQNSVSPAYLFAFALHDGFATCSKGGALKYLAQLVAFGSPTRARVPYQPDCDYFDTIQNQADFPDSYPKMRRFRIGSYAAFSIGADPAAAVQLIKEYVANGQAVAFSGSVLCGYCNAVPLQDGVIYETDTVPNSGHGQLVVGYDDNVGTPGNTGAFLIQNSFGTNWPPVSSGPSPAPRGMVYWSYDTFATTQGLAAVAYPRSPGPPAGTRLSGGQHAPLASITRSFQWAPDSGSQATYLILTHFFHDPIFLTSVKLTEPGTGVTATARYGQHISTGYSYLTRYDGKVFLPGRWAVTLEGNDLDGNLITYAGVVSVTVPQPNTPMGESMKGQKITGSTGAEVVLLNQ